MRHQRLSILCLSACLVLFCMGGASTDKPANKFFSLKQKDGRTWLADPDGKIFYSMGVNMVVPSDYSPDSQAKFYTWLKKHLYFLSREEWGKSAVEQVKKFGFNTLGAWSDEVTFHKGLPFTVDMGLTAEKGEEQESGQASNLVDVFDPVWESMVHKKVVSVVELYKDDPDLIGYFTDNELPWYGSKDQYTAGPDLFNQYLSLPAEAPGKKFLIQFLMDRYHSDIQQINAAWKTEMSNFENLGGPQLLSKTEAAVIRDSRDFEALVFNKYFEITTKAIRAIDPNHLILGCRFLEKVPDDAVAACGKYCDIVSVNHFSGSGRVNRHLLDRIFLVSGKPILITEFSFRATENQSNDRNLVGPSVTVKTQKERAEHYRSYVLSALPLPYVVGCHWYQFFDDPDLGRWDGEDSNFGLVDVEGKEYEDLKKAAIELNSAAIKTRMESPVYSFPLTATGQANNPAGLTQVHNADEFKVFNDFTQPSPDTQVWIDKARGGVCSWENAGGSLKLTYDPGKGKGIKVSIFSSMGEAADKSKNMSGMGVLSFTASLPQDTVFYLFINESGFDAAASAGFKGVAGADGESFGITHRLYGRGGDAVSYVVPLVDFEQRWEAGNQEGNQTLDLQAIKSVDLYIPGGQSAGVAVIKSVYFTR